MTSLASPVPNTAACNVDVDNGNLPLRIFTPPSNNRDMTARGAFGLRS